jgi:RND superfamily putative drug exporter
VSLWVAAVVIGVSVLGVVGSKTDTEFTLPDVESRDGMDVFDEHFGGAGSGMTAPIVFVADQGINDPEVEAAMTELFEFVEEGEDVSLISPYDAEAEGQTVEEGEFEGRMAYAQVEIDSDTSFEDSQELGLDVRDEIPEVDGLQVAVGGQMFAEFEEPTAELVGLAFAIVILIVSFGSVIAMGLPIGVALAGIGVGSIFALLLSNLMEVPEFSQMLGMMIGLGVGIDYALFIVTRFRENRKSGRSLEQSMVGAINTAGRAVTFAGITVVISILGMLIMQLPFITGMAVSVALVVAVTMAASITLLPALVGFVSEGRLPWHRRQSQLADLPPVPLAGNGGRSLGNATDLPAPPPAEVASGGNGAGDEPTKRDRIETTRWRGVIAAGGVSVLLLGAAFEQPAVSLLGLLVAVGALFLSLFLKPLKRELPPRRERPIEETMWYRWSRLIQRRPWPATIGGVVLLSVLAVPVFAMRLGFSDEGNYPEETDTRQAYDWLSDGFGDGYNGALLFSAELPEGFDQSVLDDVTTALAGTEGIVAESVTPARLNDEENPTAVSWMAFPETSPQDEATSDLVKEIRSDVLPVVTEGSDVEVFVSGTVASNIDFSSYLSDRLVYFFVAVLGLSFLLLMVVFRSVLVPLKAVIMNLLGIGAAYGVIIAGFQWGWLGPVLGIDGGPIEPFMPMMLFAIVFGLSMDYEVFLLSRIREDYDRTGDSHTSVANGLAVTARVITAAALIMIVVFGAFSLGDDRVIKMAGIGLGFAVLLDATVIRMLLVPATMELLGDRNWWLPGWLDRILPTIDVEGHEAEDDEDLQDSDGDRQPEYQPV